MVAAHTLSAKTSWSAICLDAIDVMRDSPEQGRAYEHRLFEVCNDALDSKDIEHAAKLIQGFALYFEEQLDQSLTLFESTVNYFGATKNTIGELLGRFGIAAVWRKKGRLDEAYHLCHQYLLPLLDDDKSRLAILVFNTLGVLAQELFYTEESIRHFYAAIRAAKIQNDTARTAQITANLAEVFYLSGNAEDAEALLEEAFQLAQSSKEKWLAPFVSTMLALCKVALDKYEEAYNVMVTYLDTIQVDIDSSLGHRAFCLSVAAYTLSMREELERADSLNHEAMSLLARFEDPHLKPYSWWVSGHLHRRHGRIPEAIRDLHHAIDQVSGHGYIYMPLRALNELSQLYSEVGNWQDAYLTQKKYISLYEKAQGLASRVHVQILRVKNELKEAELARNMAERAMAERRHLEVELQRMLIERETILENSIVGMVFLNYEGRVQWINTPLCQIFGVKRSDIIGVSLEPYYLSRSEYLNYGKLVSEAISRGEHFETELKMRRANGDEFWVHYSGRAVEKNNLSSGTVWVVMDISERRQLEEELNRSERHYRQLINNVTEAIVVVQDGVLIFSNPRTQTLTGRTAESLQGMPFLEVIHPDDRHQVLENHRRRLQGEVVEQYYHFRLINQSSGEIVWVELSAVMIDWEGRPATLSFVSDITQRKLLEDQLKASMDEQLRLQTLHMQNELREAELARKHAEETNHAKSMFLANMSHEIRTPMNAIIGMTHLALMTAQDAKQRDYLDKIQNASVSLLGIINDILDFSKIEAGKLEVENVEFNLDQVLNHVSTVTADKAREKGLRYLIYQDYQIPILLRGDPLRIGQVLINLVNNAVKFTHTGEVLLRIEILKRQDDALRLRFSVSDTGIGMSSEQKEKLFSPFSQADESTTRKYGGTGLGLSISKGMVELMGGTIELESAEQIGTTVSFSIDVIASSNFVDRVQPDVSLENATSYLYIEESHTSNALVNCLTSLAVNFFVVNTIQELIEKLRSMPSNLENSIIWYDANNINASTNIDLVEKELGRLPKTIRINSKQIQSQYEFHNRTPHVGLNLPFSRDDVLSALEQVIGVSKLANRRPFTTALPNFSGTSVLLVEDIEVNQQIAVELMEATGIKVYVANHGLEAIQFLSNPAAPKLDLIFMDVQMPVMDGYAATKGLKRLARWIHTPVIAMTAHAMSEEKERCLQAGMSDHLAKPIQPKTLFECIAKWCDLESGSSWRGAVQPDMFAPSPTKIVLEGIDVQEGLNRTLGSEELFIDLLRRFHYDQRHAIDALSNSIMDKNFALAFRQIHTIKGVAGLVCATHLQKCAAELEADLEIRCKLNQPVDIELETFQNLASAMQGILAELERVLVENSSSQEKVLAIPEEFNHKNLKAVLSELRRALFESDVAALDYFNSHDEVIISGLGTEFHRQLERNLNQFDFDSALALVEKVGQDFGLHIDN